MVSRSLRQLVIEGRRRLERAGCESAGLDAEVLMMHLLGVDRARLYARYADPAPPGLADAYRELIERRAAGEPVAYITGHREFMGLDFLVDPRVLVPRPETEYLVEWGLDHLRRLGTDRPVAVDVGTGSGAIAVSLARLHPAGWGALIVGSDLSRDALQVAAANRDRLAPGRVELVCGDLLDWCRPGIDLILANLPYLREEQAHPGIAREPALALYAPAGGFALYRRLLPQARDRLTADGAMACEIDPGQAQVAETLAREVFPDRRVEVRNDLAGLARYLIVEPR